MDKRELEKRTKEFALKVIQFVSSLPRTKVVDVLSYQLLKSGTSIGANYREANRAESRNDFINNVENHVLWAWSETEGYASYSLLSMTEPTLSKLPFCNELFLFGI